MAGKNSSRLASRLELGAARLGSKRLASLNEPEPSPVIWIGKIASRAELARSRAARELGQPPAERPKRQAPSGPAAAHRVSLLVC